MTRAQFGPGTIRIALMATMFVALTVALIVLQPGPDRDFAALGDRDAVTKSDTSAIDDSPPAPIIEPVALPPVPQPVHTADVATLPATSYDAPHPPNCDR